MVTLHRFRHRWQIAVYANDHGVPHFHLEGPDFRCSIAIASLEVIVGSAPKGVLAQALVWAAANRHRLARAWKEMNP
jgi:hypothetical protein